MKTTKLMPHFDLLNERLEYRPLTGDLVWKSPVGKKVKPGQIAGCKGCGSRGAYIGLSLTLSDGKRKMLLAHRIAWLLHYQEEPPELIDHEDQDPHNNKIENLRDGSGGVNHVNRKTDAPVLGVQFVRPMPLSVGPSNNYYWRASFKGKVLYSGKDFFEACCARKPAENRYWATHG